MTEVRFDSRAIQSIRATGRASGRVLLLDTGKGVLPAWNFNESILPSRDKIEVKGFKEVILFGRLSHE